MIDRQWTYNRETGDWPLTVRSRFHFYVLPNFSLTKTPAFRIGSKIIVDMFPQLPRGNNLLRRIVWFCIAILGCAAASAQHEKRPAVPIDPFAAIFDAFGSNPIVALGEGEHNNEQGHAFRLSLIRHPKFALTVNDIVVEFGSARYQTLMDRYIRGDSVPANVLRQAWQNTTQISAVWDVSIYEDFFRSVRAVNAKLPKERQLRVLLGDPPVEVDSVRPIQTQARELGTRDGFAADLIRREVLAKQRRALVIYGDMHFVRGPYRLQNIVARLESGGAKVFTVHTDFREVDLARLQPNISRWPEPSLALIRGTTLQHAPFRHDISGRTTNSLKPSSTAEIHGLDGNFDALLYLGHPLTITYARFTSELCADTEYIRMRTRRIGDPEWGKKFKAICESPLPILPRLWRTYLAKGIAATLGLAPTANALYPGGAMDLYRLADGMLKRQKVDDAIAVLEMNAKTFPRDALSLNTLAEAYAAKGDVLDSLNSSRRVLAIHRNDRTARRALGLDR